MAIYEYRCQGCGNEFEKMKPISKADEPSPCPKCGGQAQKLVSVFASGESYKLNIPKGEAFRGGATPATTASARPAKPAKSQGPKKARKS